MPTKNIMFLGLVIRHFFRKYKYRLTLPVVTLILGAAATFGTANYTSIESVIRSFIEDQESEKSIRTFDDVIRDLSEKPVTVFA